MFCGKDWEAGVVLGQGPSLGRRARWLGETEAAGGKWSCRLSKKISETERQGRDQQ